MGTVCEFLQAIAQECTCVLLKGWTPVCPRLITSTFMALYLPWMTIKTATAAEATRENVEAAYLFRFLNFVDFPTDTPAGSSAFCLCTLGGKQLVMGQLAETAAQPILTITDLPDLRQHGEVIHLSFRDDRLRFEIDVEDAKRRGLSISSRLIQLSRSSQ